MRRHRPVPVTPWLVPTVAAFAIGAPAAAQASEETTSTKHFSVPPQCGNESAFAREIRERVGSDAELLLEALEVSIEATEAGFALSMRIGNESKHLEDRRCDDLFHAAVVIAVALWEAPRSPSGPDATEVPASPPRARAASATDERTSSDGASAAPATSSRVAPESRHVASPLHAWLQGEAGAFSGLTPDWAPTFGVRGALEGRRIGLVTGLRVLLPNGDRDDNGRGVSIFALGTHVSAYVRPVPRLNVEFGAAAHLLRGRGLGSQATDTALLGSIGPRLGLWVTPLQTARLALSLGVEGQLALIRPAFEISDYGRVFRAATGNVGGFLSVGYRIF
ncbi:MAG: hypothetical protein QM784_29060 [Polyangiaceae bacterium]